VCAVVILGLLTRLPSWGLIRVTAWVMLTLVFFSPVVWGWYLLWPVLLFAATAGRRETQLIVVLSVTLLFNTLPGGQETLQLLGRRPAGDQLTLVLVTALILYFASPAVVRRLGTQHRVRPRPPEVGAALPPSRGSQQKLGTRLARRG